MNAEYGAAALIWVALVAYGIFGGADFGGGVWDLIALGPRADRRRAAIANALGPVWEANNVWLIFVIVGTFTAFPVVFSTVSTALFIPMTIALIGIVLRGASFVFRAHSTGDNAQQLFWGRIFSASSVVTPFVMGMSGAALASGIIHVQNGIVVSDFWTSWTTPFAFACGAFALGLCATLAATYLTVESVNARDTELEEDFRWRALVAGGVTAIAGAVALALSSGDAPVLWQGLIHQAALIVLGAMLIGILVAFALINRRYTLARLLLIGEFTLIFLAWAAAQEPMMIVPDLTIKNAASADIVLQSFIIATLIGMMIFLPSLWFLFKVFKSSKSAPISH